LNVIHQPANTNSLSKIRWVLLIGMLIFVGMQIPAQAHLMAVDRATLNLRDDGAFMALSLPPSSFAGIQFDDDGDGVISHTEFVNHQKQLHQAISQNVQLMDDKGPLLLEGLFVSFEPAHTSGTEQPAIVALGKFTMRPELMPTRWSIELWALQSLSNPIEAKVTSQAADGSVLKQQSLIFTPSKSSQRLFPSQAYEIGNFGWISAAVLFVLACAFFFLRHRSRP